LEFVDEEEEEFTYGSGEEVDFERERDLRESSSHFAQSDNDNIHFDAYTEEPLQMPRLCQRATFERYIGEHLIGEDNISDSEAEEGEELQDVIGYLGSDRE